MINNLCERLNQGIDVRQTLSQLRREIKNSDNQDLVYSRIADGNLDLCAFLKSSDAKTRKNAALLIGDLKLSDDAAELFHAYESETTLFVRESYLTALKHLDASDYLPKIKARYEELSNAEMPETEKKHLEKELHALSDLILSADENFSHRFSCKNQELSCILRTNPLHPDITEQQIDDFGTTASRAGVRVTTRHLDRLLPIRTYHEILFQIPGMQTCRPTPESAAKTIAQSELLDILSKTHDGDFPFYFRIGMKSHQNLASRSEFTKKTAALLETFTNRKLMNSTSHYELEIRMIESKTGNYHLLVKFHTIKDTRFSYRKEFIPTSIKPVNAALLVQLAKEYMIPDAQVLDPFCGVGTMLIERQNVVKANTSYGIDYSPEAIEKAIKNTKDSGQIIHYINKDFFTFTHEYSFDEIFTEMPYATGQKSEKDIYETYCRFFPAARQLLTPDGTVIMCTRNREYVKRLAPRQHFHLLKEWNIARKPEIWLMVLGTNKQAQTE